MNDRPVATFCVFAKSPTAGAVKTRLARSLGSAAAATLARAFIADTVALCGCISGTRTILAYAGDPVALPPLQAGVEAWEQGEGRLDQRIERVLRRALEVAPIAVAVGADSPGVPAASLEAALAALERHDAVIGPADDGGFYLLGVKHCPPGLLSGVPWSVRETATRTAMALEQHDMRPALAAPWFDVDELEDLQRLQQLLASGAASAPETFLAIKGLGLIVGAPPWTGSESP